MFIHYLLLIYLYSASICMNMHMHPYAQAYASIHTRRKIEKNVCRNSSLIDPNGQILKHAFGSTSDAYRYDSDR